MKLIEDLPKYKIDEYGFVYRSVDGFKLKRRKDSNGYWVVNLRDGDGKNVFRLCHRLVAFAYLKDSYQEGYVVNHKDFDKENCHVSNLEWVTYKENSDHYTKNKPEHASNHRRTIDIKDIEYICKLIQEGRTTEDISNITGKDKNTISKVRTKALYSWLTKDLDLPPEPAKFSISLVRQICDLLEYGFGCKEICNLFDNPLVNKKSVNNIKYRNSYEDISKDYTWWIGKYISKSERRLSKTSND